MRIFLRDILLVMKAILLSVLVVSSVIFLSYHFVTIPALKTDIDEKLIELRNKELILTQKQKEIEKLETKLVTEIVENKSLEDSTKRQEEEIRKLQEKITKIEDEKIVVNYLGTENTGWTEGWEITHYSLNYSDTGKHPGDKGYGITKSGRPVQDEITIAVDPNLIPLGTWVEIELPTGEIIKRRADDTGSAIKGKVIDLYVADKTPQELRQMGRIKKVKLRILGKEAMT